MKKFLIIFGLVLGFASAVYADGHFCCDPSLTKEQCCAGMGKMYCPNDNSCRTRCLNVTPPECIGGCINPECKCCAWCPTVEVCARMGKCQKIVDGCYQCVECSVPNPCPAPQCMNEEGVCCDSCPRTCPDNQCLVKDGNGCYVCGECRCDDDDDDEPTETTEPSRICTGVCEVYENGKCVDKTMTKWTGECCDEGTVSCCPLTEGDCACYPIKDNCECEPPKKVSSEGVCCDENWTFVTDIDCMRDGLCYFENDRCPLCVPCGDDDDEPTETVPTEPEPTENPVDDTDTTSTDTGSTDTVSTETTEPMDCEVKEPCDWDEDCCGEICVNGECCPTNTFAGTEIDCMRDGLCYFENDGCPICVPCETETTDSELTETTSSEPDDDDDTETTETDTEGCYPACGEGESCCGGECIPTPTCDEKNCMGLTEDGCACESKKSTHATGYCCDETEECCSLNGGCERCVPANDCDACYCADVKAYRCGTDLVSMTFCCNPSMHEGGCHWPGCQEGDLVLANLEDCEEENQGGLGFEEPENTVTDTEWEDICQPAPHGCSELKSYGGRITREYYCKEDEECCGTEICCPKWMECIEGKRCECPEGEILMEDGTCQKCVEGYDAYCTKFGSTVAGEDLCFDVSCSSNTLRTCEVQKIDNVFACCPEGEQAFCLKYDEKYDEKYDCIEASCCVGQRFPQSTYEDGRPKQDSCCDSSKVVQALTIDGSTKVPDGGIVNACVSSGETAFCLGYDENGKCTGVGVNSNTCTPYVDEYYENGKPKAGSCCSSMPYIYTTYDDGTPKTRRCCADGKKVIPIKVSATENASDGGYVNACVDSGETAYCSSYDEKGKCTSKSSSSSACTPYVSAYYENGNPKSGGCCDISSKKLTAFDAPNGGKVGVCHDSSRTAYCYSYDENGKCTYAASSPSACTPYVSEYYENGKPKSGRCGTVGCTPYVGKTYDDGTPKTGSCCASGSTVQAVTIDGTTKVPNGGYVNWCVNSGYTAYCATYDENGKCSGVYTSSSACTPYRYDSLTGRCCNTSSGLEMEKIEEKTWCRYKEGQCSASKKHAFNGDTGICCGRSSNIVSVASGVDMCVSDGYSAYCKDVDEDGVCVEAGVCEPSKIVTTFGILGICHKTSEKGLCTRYSKKGKCLDVGTCNGTPYIYSTYDDGTSRKEECCSAGSNLIMPVEINEKDYAPDGGIVKYCVSSGSTAFCSSYDENGKCTTVGTSSTACTPYVSEYWEKGKPKKGNCCSGTPYIHSTYDDGTPKTRGCCADGKKVIPIKVSTTENASDGGYVNTCVSSGENAYCSSYYENGKCMGSGTSSSVCTPYVSAYYENGKPKTGGCCSSSSTLTEFDGIGGKIGVCHNSSYTAYCSSYDENGKCTYAYYSSSTCTPYVKEFWTNGKPKTGDCCSSSATLTKFDDGIGGKFGYCHNSSKTAYCASYNENGKCIDVYTSPFECVEHVIDYAGTCVPKNGIPYCKTYNGQGKCVVATYSLVENCQPYQKSATEGACCIGNLIWETHDLIYPICTQDVECMGKCDEKSCQVCNAITEVCESLCSEGEACCGGKCFSKEEMECHSSGACKEWSEEACACVRKCTGETNCCPSSDTCSSACQKNEIWDSSSCTCTKMCEDGQTYCKTQDVCVDTTECTGNCEHWNSNTCSCEYKCTAEQNCCPQSSVCTAPCEDGKVWNSSACWCVEAP